MSRALSLVPTFVTFAENCSKEESPLQQKDSTHHGYSRSTMYEYLFADLGAPLFHLAIKVHLVVLLAIVLLADDHEKNLKKRQALFWMLFLGEDS
jgi:hypothetical protein